MVKKLVTDHSGAVLLTAFSVPIKIFSKNPLTVHTVTNIITV
ncbi:hypothetical protein CLOSTHATH_01936 [Hungatella hathewayi DSM 13479]|uniref:Uncharacterized protein n=1 Tax=Hungatella hathewayi DSM 13479 TaxID=566550 RepID=D3AEA5_9FIRM|nr:hypothetical protein CLOSTHATH_01936 [Hungatella hathewayi DSM 13479]